MSLPVRKNLALMLLAALLVATPAGAAKPKPKSKPAGNGRPATENTAARPEAISKDEAVAMVRARTGGKVVRAERSSQQGRTVYRIRVLTAEGRVREYRVDAATGAMD
ncbi:MAG: PepSY domain-containing protein [Gammaproteobacteria bacterium]|nr:PepSY domain-containing protein [Gammaproteobacteria bacterium]